MRKTDSIQIGDIYGKMLNHFKYAHQLKESKDDNAFGKKPDLIGKGPHTDGYNKALNDEENCCDHCEGEEDEEVKSKRQKTREKLDSKLKDPNISPETKKKLKKQLDLMTAEESEEEIFLKENEKKITKIVNSNMSKSVFDKLYNKVLKENFGQDDSDLDALGLDDATPDSELGDDLGEDGLGEDVGDEVSFTLPRDVAQQLVDVLKGVLGEDEGLEDEGLEDEDFNFEDDSDDMGMEDEDEDEMSYEEDEEEGTKTAPDKKKAYMGKDNKVSGPPKPKGGKAKADVTDDTNTTNSAPPIAALQGKNNQVPGSTLKKASDYFK